MRICYIIIFAATTLLASGMPVSVSAQITDNYPSQSEFSFSSTVKGRFKATLRLLDKDGLKPERAACTHTLWAAYQYGDDAVENVLRLITVKSRKKRLVFDVRGMPGIEKNEDGEKAGIHVMATSSCDLTEYGLGVREITSATFAQRVYCGKGRFPAKRKRDAARWLVILRDKLLELFD